MGRDPRLDRRSGLERARADRQSRLPHRQLGHLGPRARGGHERLARRLGLPRRGPGIVRGPPAVLVRALQRGRCVRPPLHRPLATLRTRVPRRLLLPHGGEDVLLHLATSIIFLAGAAHYYLVTQRRARLRHQIAATSGRHDHRPGLRHSLKAERPGAGASSTHRVWCSEAPLSSKAAVAEIGSASTTEEGAMLAVIGRVELKPDRAEEVLHDRRTWSGNVAGTVGSNAGHWARNLDGDEIQHSFWLFDTEENARDAEATFKTLREIPDAPATFVSVDVCAVASRRGLAASRPSGVHLQFPS